jgi:hypothetical protein
VACQWPAFSFLIISSHYFKKSHQAQQNEALLKAAEAFILPLFLVKMPLIRSYYSASFLKSFASQNDIILFP